MIYLDYAANTPSRLEVLDSYIKATNDYIANPNSSHKEGVRARNTITECSDSISKYFNCSSDSIIYTSGASESNNLVIKGVSLYKQNSGKHIIISSIEHSSIVAPCNYLTDLGFEVSVISINKDGLINLDELRSCLRNDTILVSITSVDSELGTRQPIEEIANILNEYPNCVFHTDATQAIGKTKIDFSNVDFVTFAPHKFGGLNGMGVLVNRNNLKLIPLIHGGKSTTIYRSGTPVVSNAVSTKVTLELVMNEYNDTNKYLDKLNKYLIKELSSLDYVHINSTNNSILSTINFSLINIDSHLVVSKLSDMDIYLSTTSACSLDSTPSKSVYAITGDINLSKNSIRISISKNTTMDELEIFINKFKEVCRENNKN